MLLEPCKHFLLSFIRVHLFRARAHHYWLVPQLQLIQSKWVGFTRPTKQLPSQHLAGTSDSRDLVMLALLLVESVYP